MAEGGWQAVGSSEEGQGWGEGGWGEAGWVEGGWEVPG
jgi:hypothetical protein